MVSLTNGLEVYSQPQVPQTTDSLVSFVMIDTDTSGLANSAPATELNKMRKIPIDEATIQFFQNGV